MRIGADADGVDPHVFLGRQARRCQWVDLPAVVGAVGDQHQHAALRWTLAQTLEGQANGVADGRVLAGNADLRFVEEGAYGMAVEG
ncbi:hypothetical protein D3C72_1612490 [compost metagenome]